jgi:LysR family transcriptional regulator, glycine cleavage system transcriptional activator
MNQLPPLNSLRTFSVVAKHLNFSLAAEELCVTQGAVSKQIKILEDFLGITLFERKPQKLLLTAEATLYYNSISAALGMIHSSTRSVMEQKISKNDELTINTLPSLGLYWLIPRISRFNGGHLRIITGDDTKVDFTKINADIAIRVGNKRFENVNNYWLMDEEMSLICSPNLFSNKDTFTPSILTEHTWLAHTSRPSTFNEWTSFINLPAGSIKSTLGFEHFFMLIKAAIDGLGFALVPTFLVGEDLAAGRLINPGRTRYKTGSSYYLLSSKNTKKQHNIDKFYTWLKEDIANQDLPLYVI